MVLTDRLKQNWFRYAVHLGALAPLTVMLWDYFNQRFLVDLVREVTSRTGKTALILLILSLACTPLNVLFNFKWALRVRRALGLYAFLYAALHFLTFVWLDYGFDWELIWGAIFEQRFVVVGAAAFVVMLLLAVTSTKGWMRRLGKRWKRLHRLVYAAGVFAVVHFLWLVKDLREPLIYGAIVATLLLLRLAPVRRGVTRLRQLARVGHTAPTSAD